MYDFYLTLDIGLVEPGDWMDAVEDSLFERFQGDATPGVRAGEPRVSFMLEAETLDKALRRAINAVEALGYGVKAISVEPGAIPA